MQIKEFMFKPKEFKHPEQAEVEKSERFYMKRLSELGYINRDEESYSKLANYFGRYYLGIRHNVRNHDIEYDKPKKGLFLFGNTGSGKTMAIQIFAKIFGIDFFYADDLARIYAIDGERYFWSYVNQYEDNDIIIDDLGSEREVKNYGNTTPFVDFLYKRERIYKDNHVLTHFTTNAVSREVLIKKYGDRVVSRLLGMCEFIRINAPDARIVKI